MPATPTRNTLARHWELLQLVPTRAPGHTAGELHEKLKDAGFETSRRTVERDLQELERVFPLQCSDAVVPYRWCWMPGSAMHLPGIGMDEALTLRLVEESIRPLLPIHMLRSLEPRFRQARDKLQALAGSTPGARWANKVARVSPELELQPPVVDEACLEVLQQALLQDRQVACRYYAAHQDRTRDYTLNPLAMVQRGQTTYLLAVAEPHTTILQLPLQRFESVRLLETPSRQPAGFDLTSYLASGAMGFGVSDSILLEAWINDWLVRQLQETPLSADMTLEPCDEGALLRATVNNSWALQFWILSHAGSIQIHGPDELRQVITQRLKQGLELHQP